MTTFSDIFEKIAAKYPPQEQWTEEKPTIFYCTECRWNRVQSDGDLCPDCVREKAQGYQVLSLAGRCRTGSDGTGQLYHAVPFGTHKALCNARPGRRSVGWSEYHGKVVTCLRCLKKIEPDQQDAEAADTLDALNEANADDKPEVDDDPWGWDEQFIAAHTQKPLCVTMILSDTFANRWSTNPDHYKECFPQVAEVEIKGGTTNK